MNLVSYVKGILDYSEGMKPATRDKALKETIQYYRRQEQKMIDSMQDAINKGSSFAEYHLWSAESQQSLLEQVIRGKTTFQQELSKIIKDPAESIKRKEEDSEYSRLEHNLTQFFTPYLAEAGEQTKMMDETIARLYLNKPKKKKSRDSELWREIL
mgnify:CR=1 FL=1